MVVRSENELTDAEVDRIFQALADSTRRDIVRRVLQREQSVSELAERYAMSFAAVQKHVAVLERASLVIKQRRGKEQLVSGNPEALRRAADLLDQYEDLWRHRVTRMEEILTEDQRPDSAAR
jgi:DNA-binding transcriptional ArsR family regulator